MKKKLLLTATALFTMTFLAGCSGGTYSKYVELGEYKGLEINMVKSEVTDDMVEEEIEGILEENTTFTEIKEAAKEGNNVNIDFTGKIDGEEFDGGSSTDLDVELGSGFFFEEIETQLIGTKAGDKKEVEVVFPDDYYDETLAGQKAIFDITVNSVSVKEVPELTDGYVTANLGYATVAEYKENLKAELLESYEDDNRYAAATDVLIAAVENATINGYPQELYDKCKTEYDESMSMFAEMYGLDISDMELDDEDTKSEVEETVNQEMVAITIAEKEKIKVSEDEYAKYLTDNYEMYDFESTAAFEEAHTKEKLMNTILLEKVQDFLIENAKITYVSEEEYYGSFDGGDSELIEMDDIDTEELSEDFLDDVEDDTDEGDADAVETETDTEAGSEE